MENEGKKIRFVKYPKFILLFITFMVAYLIFAGRDHPFLNEVLTHLGYVGTFIAGMMYAYGFTAGPATSILLILSKEQNILVAGIIAGLGALLSDLLIFKLIRHSFYDEIEMLSNEKIILWLTKTLPSIIKKYLLSVCAAIIIASPLPDEIGVSMMASDRRITEDNFMLFSFLLNTLGIFVILWIGTTL